MKPRTIPTLSLIRFIPLLALALTAAPAVRSAAEAPPAALESIGFRGPNGDGRLYAVDGATGIERWRFPTGGPIDGAAAYASGIVAVESRDGNIYGLDARSGRERWRVPLGADLPHRWGWDFLL